MPTLTQLEYAVAVDTHRHFGKAARACHVSQPTLSTQLAKLEDEMHVVLFDRTKQPVVPTEEGEALLAQARVVVAELRRFEKIARGSDDVSGPFRLGVIPTVAPYLVPLFLGSFLEKHPKVELSIEEMQTDALLSALTHERIDAALLATPVEESGFEEQVLFYEPFYLYVGEGHALAHEAYVDEKQIPAGELWLLSDGHCLRGQVLQLCTMGRSRAKRGEPQALLPARFEGGNLETLARLVERGMGCTLLPYLAVMPHLKGGTDKGTGAKSAASTATKTLTGGVSIPFAAPVPAREISLLTYRRHTGKKIRDALAESILASLPRALRKEIDVRVVPAS